MVQPPLCLTEDGVCNDVHCLLYAGYSFQDAGHKPIARSHLLTKNVSNWLQNLLFWQTLAEFVSTVDFSFSTTFPKASTDVSSISDRGLQHLQRSYGHFQIFSSDLVFTAYKLPPLSHHLTTTFHHAACNNGLSCVKRPHTKNFKYNPVCDDQSSFMLHHCDEQLHRGV